MVRALYTAASGMTAQQTKVDTITNNIANVNTVGYKKENASFKSLLYQNINVPQSPDAITRPESLQVGHGVRLGAITKDFSTGSLEETGNLFDLAIIGEGFFSVLKGEEVQYTKDGSFNLSLVDESTYAIVTSTGEPLLSTDGEPILIDSTIPAEDITIQDNGMIVYLDPELGVTMDIAQIQVVQFPNVEGLEATGNNLYRMSVASGEPLLEVENEIKQSQIKSGWLETSNVNIAEEMVNLIMAQRAYEMNSTAIKTADTMMQQANELKRS